MTANSLPLLGLHERFNKESLAIMTMLSDDSRYVVSSRVLYFLPDAPNVLNEFVHQQDDVFEPGLPIVKTISAFEKRLQTAKGLSELATLSEQWANFVDHVPILMQQDSWHYKESQSILFRTKDRAAIADIANVIPFTKSRAFMQMWAHKIDGLPREVQLSAKPSGMNAPNAVQVVKAAYTYH